jgi:archaellum component FlaC
MVVQYNYLYTQIQSIQGLLDKVENLREKMTNEIDSLKDKLSTGTKIVDDVKNKFKEGEKVRNIVSDFLNKKL